jgi:hypothetical protein
MVQVDCLYLGSDTPPTQNDSLSLGTTMLADLRRRSDGKRRQFRLCSMSLIHIVQSLNENHDVEFKFFELLTTILTAHWHEKSLCQCHLQNTGSTPKILLSLLLEDTRPPQHVTPPFISVTVVGDWVGDFRQLRLTRA